MPIALYRIDDRLIHGQVVVGWGVPMGAGFIVLADDDVAAAEWEQELYRMGVPPQVEVIFATIETAAASLARYADDPRTGILLTGTPAAMRRLAELARERIPAVNVGGVHHRDGRVQRLRYVFLSGEEEADLRRLASEGSVVTAQDVPSARAVPLAELLSARGTA